MIMLLHCMMHSQVPQQVTGAAEVTVVRGDAPEIGEGMHHTEEEQVIAGGLAEETAVSEGKCVYL
jgi:hypothetical protein